MMTQTYEKKDDKWQFTKIWNVLQFDQVPQCTRLENIVLWQGTLNQKPSDETFKPSRTSVLVQKMVSRMALLVLRKVTRGVS